MAEPPFWKTTPLAAMTAEQWESLCDGCGRCCLHKLRHEETEELAFTRVACRLLDLQTCRCTNYAQRQRIVPDCVALRPDNLSRIDWLPPSCAYRLVAEGQDLPSWHPLRTGDPDSVHKAGASVRGRAIDEQVAGPPENHIVAWPGRMPRRRRA